MAGHTRPNEEHDETLVVSAIRFQMFLQPSQPLQPFTSSSTIQNTVLEMDIEAQQERLDELMVVVERTQ